MLGTISSTAKTRPAPAARGIKRLAQHALEHHRQLSPHLGLLIGRKHIEDAVDGLNARVGVEGREHQVTGLGDHQRRSMVSRSRISPTRMTSGSCRSTYFSAFLKESVSAPTSR